MHAAIIILTVGITDFTIGPHSTSVHKREREIIRF